MTTSHDLDRIASAEVTIEEARAILRSALKRKSASNAKGVDRALRSWVWKALTSRRSDPELEDWHGLLEQVRVRVAVTDAQCAARISVLGELIYESISSADISDPKLVLQRSHTREILRLLAASTDGRLERSHLKERLMLQEANLTRVINMLVDAGLVSKTVEGKRVIVEITKAGEREVGARAPGQPLAPADTIWAFELFDPTAQLASLSEGFAGNLRRAHHILPHIAVAVPRELSNPIVTYHHRGSVDEGNLHQGGPYSAGFAKPQAIGLAPKSTHAYVNSTSPDPVQKISGMLSYARDE